MRKSNLLLLAGLLALAIVAAREAEAGPPPSGWTARDIGNPNPSGRTEVEGSGADAVWTITGTGSDIWNAGDQFQFVYTTLPGDGGVTARLLSQSGGHADGWAKTGTMLRETTSAGSRCAYMPYSNGNKFEASWRVQSGTTPGDFGLGHVGRTLADGPIWIRTQRRGQTYEHLLSDDGRDWTLIGSQKISIPANKPILAGLCASMHGGETPVAATFDNVSVTPEVVRPTPPGPSPVQAVPGTGTVLLTYGSISSAVGYNIYRRQAGEPISARVRLNAQPTANTWFTDGADGPGLPNGTPFIYAVRALFREINGGVREGLASREVLAVPQEPIPPGFMLYHWNTTSPATVQLKSRALAFSASGDDIWDVADSGAFLAMPATGDYTLSVRVVEKPEALLPNTSNNVKAGPMIREGVGPSDRYAFVFTTSGRGVLWEGNRKTRLGGDGSGRYSQQGTLDDETDYPLWLKLTRVGSALTAYQSSDGTTYLPVGDPQEFRNLPRTTYAGLAMSSGNGAG